MKEPSAAGDTGGNVADGDQDQEELAAGASKAAVAPSAREENDEVRQCLESLVARVANSAQGGEGPDVAMGAKVEHVTLVAAGVPVEVDQEGARAPLEQLTGDVASACSGSTRIDPGDGVDGAALDTIPGEDPLRAMVSEAGSKDECPTNGSAPESVETVGEDGSPSAQAQGSGRCGESRAVAASGDGGEGQAPEAASTRDARRCRGTEGDVVGSARPEHGGVSPADGACVTPASSPRGGDVTGPGEPMQSGRDGAFSSGERGAEEIVGQGGDGDGAGAGDARPAIEGSGRSQATEDDAPPAGREPGSRFGNLAEPPARAVGCCRARDPSAIDLYACLDHFMAEEELVAAEGNGYDCEGCRSRGGGLPTAAPDGDDGDGSDGAREEEPRRILRDARKRLLMLGEPPGVLVCHLKRLQAQKKIQTRVDFPEELDMGSYFWRDLEVCGVAGQSWAVRDAA